ncbi:alpha/beta hydrolase family protein [Cellulomonas marina]|uniref:Dipeptidyl aminopeptidase/acylaminoacyl peptidase n=1 Tax=Cellulomonas marina TaxID=988821 RepID=A0A1I0VJB5_9CELL|nr:S9 family peptidase [Cellulomonas marina]GIG27927.1 hypothetical protein Cma02nite_05270 [Cellulomonas marina]SFA76484.1 Dipeptidyl aminopeptidase/acylaminoacyl peptidase [Cellulomonas marina]
MLPDDIALLRTPGRAAVLPDGSAAVVAVLTPDLAADETTGSLWRVPLATRTDTDADLGTDLATGFSTRARAPHRLTRGHRDTEPVVSPDGQLLAFVRAAPGSPGQLHLLDLQGGEPVALTDAPLGVQRPRFSPDGRRLLVLARVPEEGRYVRGGDPAAEAPRLVDTFRYRADGVGFVHDRPRHAHVLDVPTPAALEAWPAAPRDGIDGHADGPPDGHAGGDGRGPGEDGLLPHLQDVTPGEHDVAAAEWWPAGLAGDAVLVVAGVHAGRGTDLRADALLLPVPATTAGTGDDAPWPTRATRLTDADAGSTLGVVAAAASPDGSAVWLLAQRLGEGGRDFVGRPTTLHHLALATDGHGDGDGDGDGDGPRPAGEPRALTDEDVDLDADVLVPVGDEVLVARVHRGAQPLLAVAPDGTARTLVEGPLVVTAAAPAPDGGAVVTAAAPDSAGDLHRLRADGTLHRLTDLSAPLRAAGLRPAVELHATAPDGTDVHGWVVRPDPGAHPAPHPTLLMIHGGPHAQYTGAVFDEAQVLARAGYAVVMGNPRGSAGYGRAHATAIHRAMGTVDTDDVLALLDEALRADDLDAGRTGVLGGSYGGYLTAWLTTRTDRFAAAVVERGFLDPVSFVGSSDIGWFFGLEYVGDDATPEGAAQVAAQSPMAHVGAVRTPTLVVHSEQDWRCPVEQGQRWFVELRRRGVPTRLLLFPGEGHELSRSGRPRHRVARFEHLLRWFDERLPVTGRSSASPTG